jgi:pimeloyl-ACP methyl ester carboxylesterase
MTSGLTGVMMPSDVGEAAQGHYVSANGLNIYYEEQGVGPPLLLIQGGFDTHEIWRSQLPILAPHFRVITSDSRGLGRTDHPGGAVSYEMMAEDVLALSKTLGLEKPLICGIGDGACVALQIAVWAPESAAAYVFIAAWLWNAKEEARRGMLVVQDVLGLPGPLRMQLTDQDLELIERSQSWLVFDYFQRAHQPLRGPEYWKTFLKNMWPAWTTLTEHGAEDLQRITTPSLVLVGDRDPFQPLNLAVELYRRLPNADLAVIPGMDHDVTAGKHAALVGEVVLNFLLRQVETAA